MVLHILGILIEVLFYGLKLVLGMIMIVPILYMLNESSEILMALNVEKPLS